MRFQRVRHKMKGGTLLEVLISLSLLSLTFVIGVVLFQSLTGIYSPVQRFKTYALVKEQLYEPIGILIEDRSETEILGRRLIKRIKPLDQKTFTYQIEVEAYWGETFLEKRSRLVIIEP